jgi:hypothetical protein
MAPWLGILLLALFAGAGAKFLDVWLQSKQKARIHEKLLGLWYALGESDPRVVIQAPIRLITRGLTLIYGEKLFSWMALRRASLVTLILFACALVVAAFYAGFPFSADDLPWRTFDRTYEAVEVVAKSKTLDEEKPEWKGTRDRILRQIRQYNNLENRIMYSILFFPCIAAVAAALNLGSIAFARQALSEMVEARSLVTLFSLGLGNLVVSILIYVLGLSLICVIAVPFSWLVLWGLLACGQQVSWLLAFALLLPSILVALFFGTSWIKVLASVMILHGALVIVMSLGALFLFPVRKAVRWVLLEFLDRALSYEKGFFAFCAVAFALLATLAVQVAKILTGRLPF